MKNRETVFLYKDIFNFAFFHIAHYSSIIVSIFVISCVRSFVLSGIGGLETAALLLSKKFYMGFNLLE